MLPEITGNKNSSKAKFASLSVFCLRSICLAREEKFHEYKAAILGDDSGNLYVFRCSKVDLIAFLNPFDDNCLIPAISNISTISFTRDTSLLV